MTDDEFKPFVPRPVSRRPQPPSEPVPALIDATPQLPTPTPCDPAACAAELRSRAIRIAAEACARALREAVARNPLFVARFVDDALRAAGNPVIARIRLHPEDARACAPLVTQEIVSDDGMERGEVSIELDAGTIGATIAGRAGLLVRAVADA